MRWFTTMKRREGNFKLSCKLGKNLMHIYRTKQVWIKVPQFQTRTLYIFSWTDLSHAKSYSWVKLERKKLCCGVRLRTMFPCGVNNTQNKCARIKGEVGAQTPAWEQRGPNLTLWALSTRIVAKLEKISGQSELQKTYRNIFNLWSLRFRCEIAYLLSLFTVKCTLPLKSKFIFIYSYRFLYQLLWVETGLSNNCPVHVILSPTWT